MLQHDIFRSPILGEKASQSTHFTNVKYSVIYFTKVCRTKRGAISVSYAICRMQKMKSHDLKGMQFHNQRERESKTNPDIDKSRTELNYDLVNEQNIDYNKRVHEIINSQKESPRKTRKDAVLVNELVITSDRKFFDGLSDKDQKRFFEESYKMFSERYGKQNIAYATVHNDEKTPHLHLGVVPMRDGRLQGKNIFNRQELQWIQEEFPKYLQSKGFEIERGEKGSDAEHLKTQDFKAKTLKENIKNLENNLEKLKGIETRINEISDIDKKAKEIPLAKQIVISKADFEEIKNVAKYGIAIRQNYEELRESNSIQTKEFQEHIKTVEQERDKAIDMAEKNGKKADGWKRKAEQLNLENMYLKGTLDNIVAFSRDKIKNFSKVVGAIKYQVLSTLEKHFKKDLSHLKDFANEQEQEGFEKMRVKKAPQRQRKPGAELER